jgi:hypothetical protein
MEGHHPVGSVPFPSLFSESLLDVELTTRRTAIAIRRTYAEELFKPMHLSDAHGKHVSSDDFRKVRKNTIDGC